MEMQNNVTVKLLEESNLDAKELETTRIKLTQLNESLNSFLTLHPQTPWPLILDKFNILITRYNQLLQEVSCKFLKECVIHPDSLPEVDPDSLPRFLLRTKFIPEIEEMESNLIVSIAGDNNQINWIDETKITAEYEKWKAQIDQHDEIAEKSIDWFEIKQKEYDFKRRIPLNEKRKRLRPELPRRRKHRASLIKKKMLSSQSKSEASPLSQSLTIIPSNLGTETEDSKSMMSETITDVGTVTDDESASSVMTESTNIVEEKDSDEDNTDDNMNSKTTSKINSGDEDSVITSATGTTSLTSSTLLTLNSSAFGSIYNPQKMKRSSTLRNEVDYDNDNEESDYEDTYNYDDSSESSSESEKEDEKNKKKTEGHKHDAHKKPAPTIANIPEFSSTTAQEGILEKMIYWLERGGEFKI